MTRRKPSEQERADTALAYASTLWHLTQEGYTAPNDIRMMLEHRLRSVLRDGPCPDCPNCALHAALEAATDG